MSIQKQLLYMMLVGVGVLLSGIVTHAITIEGIDREKLIEMKGLDWRRVRAILRSETTQVDARLQNLMLDPLLSADRSPVGTTVNRYVVVDSTESFNTAINNARPGDFIHIQPGLYQGQFDIEVSGTEEEPIVLYGTRNAIINEAINEPGYGIHLKADHWILSGFSIRNVSKGVVMDGGNHNTIQGLKIYDIGDEAIHLRTHSSNNLIKHNWIHDTGLTQPEFGEAIYVGSSVTNWDEYTNGDPDASNNNRIISNLVGPNITAEGIDIKEGTVGGQVLNNTFLGGYDSVVDSWIDVKGNNYTVHKNVGSYVTGTDFGQPIEVIEILSGWGLDNEIAENQFTEVDTPEIPELAVVRDDVTSDLSLAVPGREVPYTLSELMIRFPDVFEQMDTDTYLLKAHLLLFDDAYHTVTPNDLNHLYMMVSDEQFTTFVNNSGRTYIQGTPSQRVVFQSWDADTQAPADEIHRGRPYVFASGGYMEVHHAAFYDLGFEEGTASGVAWKSFTDDDHLEVVRGHSFDSIYERNYFGAYSFEAKNMVWKRNIFRNNLSYGFDPHDFSNYFLVENNEAYNNGSHGIIFSRGCHHNIIRNNISYNNDGHGIMLDDGKVLEASPNPRYDDAVPSNYNTIEGNHVWDNHDGIVIEGGEETVIRNNIIDGIHRYGIRLKDAVVGSQIYDNMVKGSERYGIFIYNRSHRNNIRDNYIQGTQSGIGLQDVQGNVVQENEIYILGSAIRLKGNVTDTIIEDNMLKGNGSMPIDTRLAVTAESVDFRQMNDFDGWRNPPTALSTYIGYIALAVWLALILMPFVVRGAMFVLQRWTGVSPTRHLGMQQ